MVEPQEVGSIEQMLQETDIYGQKMNDIGANLPVLIMAKAK